MDTHAFTISTVLSESTSTRRGVLESGFFGVFTPTPLMYNNFAK